MPSIYEDIKSTCVCNKLTRQVIIARDGIVCNEKKNRSYSWKRVLRNFLRNVKNVLCWEGLTVCY